MAKMNNRNYRTPSNFIDRTGMRYGRLTVLAREENANGHKTRWRCRCDCGNESVVYGDNLGKKNSLSCGCLRSEKAAEHCRKDRMTLRHGATVGVDAYGRQAKTAEYRAWEEMKRRCYNPKTAHYDRYGGRGIAVHPEWRINGGFERFMAHIGPKPEPKHLYSLDRIDNEGNYESGNVRWATRKQQQANRSNSKRTPDETWKPWAQAVKDARA